MFAINFFDGVQCSVVSPCVSVSVCVSVRVYGTVVDLDLSYAGIVGQDPRSKVKVVEIGHNVT